MADARAVQDVAEDEEMRVEEKFKDSLFTLDQELKAALKADDESSSTTQVLEGTVFDTAYAFRWEISLRDAMKARNILDEHIQQLEIYLSERMFGRAKARAIKRRQALMQSGVWDGTIDPIERTANAPPLQDMGVEELREVLRYDLHALKEDVSRCVDRRELMKLLIDLYINLFDALLILQRHSRATEGRETAKALTEQFKLEDKSAILIQAMIRREIEGKSGREMMDRWNRTLDEGALGSMSQAADGDKFVIPAGHHYLPITSLAEDVTSVQTEFKVESAERIPVGSEIIVLRELMLVKSKVGNKVFVERRPPSILYEIMQAASNFGEKDQKSAMLKTFDRWLNFSTTGKGIDSRAWQAMVWNMCGRHRDPDMDAFNWLVKESSDVDCFQLWLKTNYSLNEFDEVEFLLDVDAITEAVKAWWSTPVAKWNVAQEDWVTTTPRVVLRPHYLEEITDILAGQMDAGIKVGTRALGVYLEECLQKCERIKKEVEISYVRWEQVTNLLDERCRTVKPHPNKTAIRGEGILEISATIEIFGDPGAVVHGTFQLQKGKQRVFKRRYKSEKGWIDQMMLLTEVQDRHGDQPIPSRLIDKASGDLLWDTSKDSADDYLNLMGNATEIHASINTLTIRTEVGDSIRISSGVWHVNKCEIQTVGAYKHDAIVCGRGAVLRLKESTVGGASTSQPCRYVLGLPMDANVEAERTTLRNSRDAALRIGANTTVNLRANSKIWNCGSVFDCTGGKDAKIELADTSIIGISRIWADSINHPDLEFGGYVLESRNKLYSEFPTRDAPGVPKLKYWE